MTYTLLSTSIQDGGDISIGKLLLPALSGSTDNWHYSHLAASVSGVCGSSVYKPKLERWHQHVPSQQVLWLKSQRVGSCSCRQDTGQPWWGPPGGPSGRTCFPPPHGARGGPHSVGCTLQSTQVCFQRRRGWSRHTRRWRHGRCGSSAPPCSSWNAPDLPCPRSATGTAETNNLMWLNNI